MGKADYARDYYGDLELQPGADANEIKKQFKKLALAYHPDRNPGRESEVTARFQRIQSAHEVLTDPTERARYDTNRAKTAHGGFSRSPGMKGNPWSHVSSQYPPPPKPPSSARAPPPSAGAQRYGKFETPKPHSSSKEGPHARTDTFKAWESMRGSSRSKPAPDKPEVPRRTAPTARQWASSKGKEQLREEDFRFVPPRSTRSSFAEAKPSPTAHTSPPKHNSHGYMPSAPGDEAPASKRAYFTQRMHPPEPPPRPQPESDEDDDPEVSPTNPGKPMETRTSTPYTMQGRGEKLNPFAPHRSHSSRVNTTNLDADKGFPRSGSDPNLASPRKSHRAAPSSQPTHATQDDSSSSDELLDIKTPRSTRARTAAKTHGPAAAAHVMDESRHAQTSTSAPTEGKRANSIFSMKIDPDTFTSITPPNLASRSSDSINTKFSPTDWHGQFTAGDYFQPDRKATSSKRRAQSGTRARGRSPTKTRPSGTRSPSESGIPMTPGGTRFSAADWQKSFATKSFAPQMGPPQPRTMKKPRGPLRATMGGAAAVVVDELSQDAKPLFPDQKPAEMAARSPDAMDVDSPKPSTPNAPSPAPPAPATAQLKSEMKRPAGPSPTVTDDEIKIGFEDLHVVDILSSLDLPKPPMGPKIRTASSSASTPLTATSPTEPHHHGHFHSRHGSFTTTSSAKMLRDIYRANFATYMGDWDRFSTRMLHHLVARKTQNDALGPNRWDDGQLDSYRHGVKVDRVVLHHWNECMEKHAGVLREYAVFLEQERRESLAAGLARDGGVHLGSAGDSGSTSSHAERERPVRKKTH